jgi:uncharacterized protein DUF3467
MGEGRRVSAERRYANCLDVSFSYEEFVLDFGQRLGDSDSIAHSGIVATPRAVRAFVEVLARSLAEYRRRYGNAVSEEGTVTPP